VYSFAGTLSPSIRCVNDVAVESNGGWFVDVTTVTIRAEGSVLSGSQQVGEATMKASVVGLALILVSCGHSFAEDLSADKIGEIIGVKATTTPDGVVRVGWPRKDVSVQVDGLQMRPFAGLGAWAAFQKSDDGVMLMGDTVVFQDEVNPAIDAAFASGLEVTAIHNHFFFDEPKVYFMHIGGNGPPDKLAYGVKAVWDAIKKVRAASPQPATTFPGGVPTYGKLDTEKLASIVGTKGSLDSDVYKITIGRDAEMHGMKFGGSMGLTTWAAIAGTDELAVVDGDFAMTTNEVQPVLKALRAAGINIVALHNHMNGEAPAIYFTHFWGKGRAEDLAAGFRSALDAQRNAEQQQPMTKHGN
jgi:hypothetical protein